MERGAAASRQPFSEHIQELRQRLIYCLVALLLGCSVGYALHDKLFALVRQPLHQKLYYTSPVAGFNSMLKLSILFGLVLALPVIMYQLSQFLKPLFSTRTRSLIIIFYSILLAALGVSFAYFVSLPAAVHFLTNIDSNNLQSLIVVNDYLNFVFNYLGGFAILFQLPLLLLLINRITPLNPKRLMGYERYVILGSFIVAAILTPTPDPVNQAIMAGPIILLYQFSVVLVWWVNRSAASKLKAAPPTRHAVHPSPPPTPIARVTVPIQRPKLISDIL